MKIDCICGETNDTMWSDECKGCGRFYHGIIEREDRRVAIWDVRPKPSKRPTGDDLVNAGVVIAIVGALLYCVAFAFPDAISTAPSYDILGEISAYRANTWKLLAFAVGAGLFALGPLVWATDQIVRAIWWVRQESEPDTPIIGRGVEPKAPEAKSDPA